MSPCENEISKFFHFHQEPVLLRMHYLGHRKLKVILRHAVTKTRKHSSLKEAPTDQNWIIFSIKKNNLL